jgi:hypothetical protein
MGPEENSALRAGRIVPVQSASGAYGVFKRGAFLKISYAVYIPGGARSLESWFSARPPARTHARLAKSRCFALRPPPVT